MILTDEEIEAIAKPFTMLVGDHWCFEQAILIESGDAEDFARAIEAAVIERIGGSEDRYARIARDYPSTEDIYGRMG